MARATVTTADRGTAIMADQAMAMAAMPLLTTAGTPQHTATLPHTTADMGTGALFAPHTHTTALGIIAGIVTVGDRHGARRLNDAARALARQPVRRSCGVASDAHQLEPVVAQRHCASLPIFQWFARCSVKLWMRLRKPCRANRCVVARPVSIHTL